MSITSATNTYCWEWSDFMPGDLSERYENWQTERDYKKTVLKPMAKIIRQAAKHKEEEIDGEIFDWNAIATVDRDPRERLHASYEKEELKRKKEAFHNIATNPDIYYLRHKLWHKDKSYKPSIRSIMMNQILNESKEKESELIEQFNEKHPGNTRPIAGILEYQLRQNEETKEDLSKTLTSAEEYDELLSQDQ